MVKLSDASNLKKRQKKKKTRNDVETDPDMLG